MENRSMFVGLDVHKETIDVSIAEGQREGRSPPRRGDRQRSRAARPGDEAPADVRGRPGRG